MGNKKVAIYARCSTEEQNTIEIQIDACKGMYPAETEFDIYSEKESGWKGNRPEYELVKRMILSGRIKELCVYSISRLGRNQREVIQTMWTCQDRGVRVRVVLENMDFCGPMGMGMLSMLAAFAQIESDMKSERIKAVFREKKRKGTFIGHGKMPHTFSEKVVEKADTVYNLLDQKKGYRQIAGILNVSEHTIGKLVKHRGHPLVTAKIFAQLFPDWHKKGKDHYPTLEQVRERYHEVFPEQKAA